jgi:aminoglycoside 6'-N-acetyltransferase I
METLMNDPLTAILVAERSGGGLCSFLEAGTRPFAYDCETRPVGYGEAWFVDTNHRGRGLGQAWVDAAKRWARQQGLHEMGSDTSILNDVGLRAHQSLDHRKTERPIHFAKKL